MSVLPAWPTADSTWADYFDTYAPLYEQSSFSSAGLAYVGEREVADVLAALRDQTPGQLLDAGAGSGRVARALAPLGWRITAIDVSTEMLARTVRNVPSATGVHAAVGERLPFADNSFDAIVSVRVLKYVTDLDFGVAEFARVLRPGGVAVIEFTNRRSVARFGYKGAPIRLVTWREAEGLFTRAGLQLRTRAVGTRLPQPVWRWARTKKRARVAIACERMIGLVLGGNRGATAARSALLVGAEM